MHEPCLCGSWAAARLDPAAVLQRPSMLLATAGDGSRAGQRRALSKSLRGSLALRAFLSRRHAWSACVVAGIAICSPFLTPTCACLLRSSGPRAAADCPGRVSRYCFCCTPRNHSTRASTAIAQSLAAPANQRPRKPFSLQPGAGPSAGDAGYITK